MSIYNDPPPGMFIVPDKENLTTVRGIFGQRVKEAVNLFMTGVKTEQCSARNGLLRMAMSG